MLERLSAADARRWAVVTRAALAARRAEIDALNVFPVPDGDTGTNLYLTFDGALDAVRTENERAGRVEPSSLAEECSALARAMLLTARGNSGVILSQVVRGFAEAIAESGVATADGPLVAAALARASERSWRAVTHPVEGTILSVAKAAAEAAAGSATLAEATESALRGATEALALTTSQLPALQRAGVVDAGGAGYVLLLEALARVAHEDGGAGGLDAASFFDDQSLERRLDWAPRARVSAPRTAPAPRPAMRGLRRARGRPTRSCTSSPTPTRTGSRGSRPRSTRSATPCSSWVAPTCGTSMCTSTTRVPPSRRGWLPAGPTA